MATRRGVVHPRAAGTAFIVPQHVGGDAALVEADVVPHIPQWLVGIYRFFNRQLHAPECVPDRCQARRRGQRLAQLGELELRGNGFNPVSEPATTRVRRSIEHAATVPPAR